MDTATFTTIVDREVARCKAILIKKGKTYTTQDEDRLGQFKAAAALQGTNSIKALGGMMAKHETKLHTLINRPNGATSLVEWNETIGDMHNYLFLLKALIEEE